MKKIGILIVLIALAISGVAAAMISIPAVYQAEKKIENSPIIGEPDEDLILTPPGLERILFIHHKKDFARPPWAGGGKGESKCYDFLGKGVKWQDLPVNYVIDPSNSGGLPEEFVNGAISSGAEEWDSWTQEELFNDAYEIVYDGSWDSNVPDGRNELLFGQYPDTNVIAVTVIWGYFSGKPSSRRIIEADILFDTDFPWGDGALNTTLMDLQNIATHELGHVVGLGDVYETTCSEVTMYGYSTAGETEKRTLDQPDITGVQELYGL